MYILIVRKEITTSHIITDYFGGCNGCRPHSARPLDLPAPYSPPLAFTRPLPDTRRLTDRRQPYKVTVVIERAVSVCHY